MADAGVPFDLPPFLPWHDRIVSQIREACRSDRMPHALLIHGPVGLGKHRLAKWLAGGLLCRAAGAQLEPCGECTGCRLVAAGSHPDLSEVAPEEGKQQISVDQIRGITDWLGMTSHQQGWKIAIVDPANLMTGAAANSLLKTLEEPPRRSLVILVAATLQGLPATLRSRCQRLAVAKPGDAAALAWLQAVTGERLSPQLLAFSGGAPLRALAAKNGFAGLDEEMRGSLGDFLAGKTDVTRVAQFWAKDALFDRLMWLDLWMMSLARQALAGTADAVTFPEQPLPLPSNAIPLNITQLYRSADRLRELRSQLLRTALNRELAVEMLLADLLTVFTRRPAVAQPASSAVVRKR